MAYIVTTNIIDTKDNNRLYEKGEVYHREGSFEKRGYRIKW